MAFFVFDINTKNAQETFKTINKGATDREGASRALKNAVSSSLKSKLTSKVSGKESVTIKTGSAANSPLVQSLTGDLFTTNNLTNTSTDVLINTQSTQSFQDLSLNEADFLQRDVLTSKIRKSVRSNRTSILNNLLATTEVQNKLDTISFPITLPTGASFGIIAKGIKFSARDFNLRVVDVVVGNNTVDISLDITLSSKGFDKLIRQLQNNLNGNEVMLAFRNNYKKEAEFIGALLALSSQDIRIGLSDFGTRLNISSTTSETREPSILQATSSVFQRLITTVPEQELVRRLRTSVALRMPKGPPGGRITQPDILTYRTGTFVRSIEAFYDRKLKAVKYFYAPNYYVHEQTGRDPRDLIEGSLSKVIQRAVGGQVRIFKLG